MATARRGAFIVIEGLDRSGKSTQASELLSQLEQANVPVKLMKFPDRTTPIGKMIDTYLRLEADIDDHAIHLLFSANRWELASSIESTLVSGTTVICDRYAFSGVAFSAAKGLPYEWCRTPDVGLPAPDAIFFLDISPEKAQERDGFGSERYEKREMQMRVREVFLNKISRELQDQGAVRWITVDAGKGLREVKEDIWTEVECLLQNGTLESISRLWQ